MACGKTSLTKGGICTLFSKSGGLCFSLIHGALANGLCISAFAASDILSNSGVDNKAPYVELKQNNPFYFHLNYFFQRALGKSRSEAFTLAKAAYVAAILDNTHLLSGGNYQFNLHNVLSYHYFGVLEYWNYNPKENFQPLDFRKASTTKLGSKSTTSLKPSEFKGEIAFTARYSTPDFQVIAFTAVKSGSGVKFTLEYQSKDRHDFSFFDPPNGEVIKKTWSKGIKRGVNKTSWKLSKREMAKLLTLKEITMLIGFEERAALLTFDPLQLQSLLE